MHPETEYYTDEEILRDAERGLEAERTHENIDESELEREDDLEISEKTGDPALDDVLKYKGGEPEDWELTHQSSGEYVFDGKEMISTKTGESLTEQIESGYDTGYILAHHETLQMLKSGESLIRLPDFEEEKGDGDVVLHVTHLLRGADNSIAYEIRSTVIGKREEEDLFRIEEVAGSAPEQDRVEFYEETFVAPEERVETVFETVGHSHETTFDSAHPIGVPAESPTAHEAALTIRVERQSEIEIEQSEEVVGEPQGKITQESWLYDFLKENIYVFPEEKAAEQGSAPVIVEKADTESTVEQHQSSVAAKVERSHVFAEPVTRLVREVVIPKMGQKSVVEKFERDREAKPITLKIERGRQFPLVEHRARTAEKMARPRREGFKAENLSERNESRRQETFPPRARDEWRRHPEQADEVKSITKPRTKEISSFDHAVPLEKSRQNERALSGQEVLQRVLGLPTAEHAVNAREIMNPEAVRSFAPAGWRTPPQSDTSSGQTTRRRTLHGITMRRAA